MKFALCLAALVAVASGAVLQAQRPLTGWSVVGKADGSKPVRVMFSLKKDMSRMDATLKAVADPDSARFREWVSPSEALRLRSPTGSKHVASWLAAHNIPFRQTNDVVTAEMNVAEAEALFGTTILAVKSETDGSLYHHALDLHAPSNVTESVAAVYGLHGKPLPPKPKRVSNLRSGVAIPIGPTEIRQQYKVTGRGSGSTKVRQAVAEFQGQYANDADLKSFFTNLVPNAQSGDDTIYAYKGNQGSGYGVEALLDIEYIMGIAPGVKTEFWAWRNFDFCSDLKNWTTTIINDADAPLVHSVSYGWQGDLSQIGCTTDEITDVDNDFKTLATRGISIIFASGDSGSAYDGSKLWPSWPASSPFVTAVGATCFTDESKSEEQATTQFGSGSGFSDMFTVATWQRQAVQAYLQSQSSLPPSNMWSRGGRGTADVSALGEGYKVYVNGQVEDVGGTSAAAPAFAALISLVNDKRVSNGQRPLGYLNPWIYKNPSFFTDVTKGTDKVSRGGSPLEYGFDAASGWDPATGLGTPKFDKLSQ
eukprot:TRINITY_DN280_c0_g1_i2.p1 TRINITY_DN280_c0_g1~~TRINITY_DN280_c0_g1_i2.p1  ORF type:complete len:549 (-),score=141.96 TRINITY_DN280_c0_g1_i2:221-1828(-)